MSVNAVNMLMNLIDHPQSGPEQHVLATKLVERESTIRLNR